MQAIIKDFQSIEEVKLNIKGFTLLIGESNQGKSATLRALRAAITNRFRSGQVRNGEQQAEVGIKFSDGEPILRVVKPEGGSATMKLGSSVFSKLGRTVPKEVADVCNMECIGDDGYNLNFHEQFESPMLLEFSQAKVMELLSDSEGLRDLNICKGGLLDKRSENKGAFVSLDAILSRLKNDQDRLDSVLVRYGGVYDELCAVELEYGGICSELECIQGLSECIKEDVGYVDRIAALRAIIEHLEDIPEDGGMYATLIGLRGEFKVLDRKVLKMSNLVKRLDTGIEYLVGVKDEVSCIDSLVDLRSRVVEYDNRVSELDGFVNGGICPICGNKVGECLC